jgi:hypothetical protein
MRQEAHATWMNEESKMQAQCQGWMPSESKKEWRRRIAFTFQSSERK